MRIAIDEVNRDGGVLGGRPLKLLIKDNRSIPARGVQNFTELSKIIDLVAVVGGRFSPVLLEQVPLAAKLQLILMAAWSSADPIVANGTSPNYVFRLSLSDDVAMSGMLAHAQRKGVRRVGLLLFNTAWGRSNLAAATRYLATTRDLISVDAQWFNWEDPSLLDEYLRLTAAGAEAIILVSNDETASLLVEEVATLPDTERLPIISHWGITGGDFVARLSRPSILEKVPVSVIQSFSFFSADSVQARRFMATAKRLYGITGIEEFQAPVGTAHAYDLTHILAKAVDMAGTTNRSAVRAALERLGPYRGLVKYYDPPFTRERHEALGLEDTFMARYRPDGVIIPVTQRPPGKPWGTSSEAPK
jgi:branched-chain amino acid transport system substrate-binding protein